MREETTHRLCCPLCHGGFQWTAVERRGTEIRTADVLCRSCGIRSEVREGIGYFLPGDASLSPSIRPRQPPPDGSKGPTMSVHSPPSDWERALARAIERARVELGEAPGPLDGTPWISVPMGLTAPSGSVRLAERFADLPTTFGDPGDSPTWDEFIVDLHSIPFVNDSIEVAVAGPGLQELPGSRVILRELHRLVKDRLMAIVAVSLDPGPASASSMTPPRKEALLDEWRQAHWSPRFEAIAEVQVPTRPEVDLGGHAPMRVQIGVVVAE